MSIWALQDAKNRFSEVAQLAGREGPQELNLRGKRAVVIISAEDYDRLVEPRQSFKDLLLSEPHWDDELVELINDRLVWNNRDMEF